MTKIKGKFLMTTKRSFKKILALSALILASLDGTEVAVAGTPSLEIVPVIVWQGVPLEGHQTEAIRSLRTSFESVRFVHFVSPVYLMRTSAETNAFRGVMASVLREGDGLGMHIAPYRDWALYSRVTPGQGAGIFGQVHESCDSVCGLDQEVAGLKTKDFAAMLSTARFEFKRVGLGDPKLALFEEGLVPEDIWKVAKESGFVEDWSGFDLLSSRTILGRYPFFQHTESMAEQIPTLKQGSALDAEGRSLDHLRFGLVLDAVNQVSVKATVERAVDLAKKQNRSVKVPLIVSAANAVHIRALLGFAVHKLRETAIQKGMPVRSWDADLAGGWDLNELKNGLTADLLSNDLNSNSSHPRAGQKDVSGSSTGDKAVDVAGQLDSMEQSKFEKKLLNELPVRDELPADQSVHGSRSRAVSH